MLSKIRNAELCFGDEGDRVQRHNSDVVVKGVTWDLKSNTSTIHELCKGRGEREEY